MTIPVPYTPQYKPVLSSNYINKCTSFNPFQGLNVSSTELLVKLKHS